MKLAILAPSYLYDKAVSTNGTFVQLHNLATAFSKSGIEVHYICSTLDTDKPEYEFIKGIHFHWIKKKHGILEWKRLMTDYKDELVSLNPDAIYTRGRNVLQHVAGTYSNSNKIPYVWGTNGEDSTEFWKNTKRLKSKNIPVFNKLALLPFKIYEDSFINRGMLKADYIINQSIKQQKFTKKNLNKTGTILPSYFLSKGNDIIVKENEILWLANLSKGKQPELFIKIISKLSLNNWSAILAGGTSDKVYENEIKDLTVNLNIQMPGKIEFKDSFNYFQKSRIYVNTSKPDADGLPNAYIQSWLSGAVVLSLHHDPNNWMRDYKIGFCANGDLNKLANKLEELINNEREIQLMSQKAVTFAKDKFSNNDIIEKYISLFKSKR